jgi:hypothetical protein
MGEYALYNRNEIKIGTCENMYYLRADQRTLVQKLRNDVDPIKDGDSGAIRFRFPFPDEDHVAPGAFGNPFRSIGIYGVEVPDGVEHSIVQFKADVGYLLSLPCPESKEGRALGLKIGKNGWHGNVQIAQQKFFQGKLILIAQCGGCGMPYRYETLSDASPVVEACIKNADEAIHRATLARNRESIEATDKNVIERAEEDSSAAWWTEIASRIVRGYK